jgi:hypothetical protein
MSGGATKYLQDVFIMPPINEEYSLNFVVTPRVELLSVLNHVPLPWMLWGGTVETWFGYIRQYPVR